MVVHAVSMVGVHMMAGTATLQSNPGWPRGSEVAVVGNTKPTESYMEAKLQLSRRALLKSTRRIFNWCLETGLIPVVVGLVGTFDGHADVIGLLLRQLG
jgi:hypothetical protein